MVLFLMVEQVNKAMKIEARKTLNLFVRYVNN